MLLGWLSLLIRNFHSIYIVNTLNYYNHSLYIKQDDQDFILH